MIIYYSYIIDIGVFRLGVYGAYAPDKVRQQGHITPFKFAPNEKKTLFGVNANTSPCFRYNSFSANPPPLFSILPQ